MEKCLCCNGENTDYDFDVIEIQTLHVRDIKGEKYVQAMGAERNYGICADCAAAHLKQLLHPAAGVGKRVIPFGILVILGVIATIFVHAEELFVRLIGPIAILCGVIGIVAAVREGLLKRKKIQSLSEKEALKDAAWQLFLEKAPKKNGDQDLTYVPVNNKTREMSVKELTVKYDLLPAIAAQVGKKIKQSCK